MKRVYDILFRYIFLILIALPNLNLFYLILTPLTLYSSYFLFNLFFDAILSGTVISFSSCSIELIDSCIAASAYYLLLILNLSIPKIKLGKRLLVISISFLVFFIANLFRIFVLALILSNSFTLFTFTHKLFWYALSTIFVVGIWFAEVKFFKIKEIPFYSDLNYLFKATKSKKKKH